MLNAHGDFVHERTLSALLGAASRLGITVDVAALAPTRYRSGEDVFLPTGEYRAALRSIFDDPRDTLGIELAGAIPVEALGLWGFLLRTSPTFGAMLQRAERYLRVFFRFTRMTLDRQGDRAILTCDHPDPSPFGRREQEVCFFLGQWLTLGRTLIGEAVVPEEVRMRWQGPVDAAPVEAFFRSPVHFGCQDDALVFDRRVCDLSLPEHTPELAEMFEGYAAAMIHRIGAEATFVDRVREVLSEALLHGTAGEEAVAREMGVTRRSLRRHLAESGLTFRRIREGLQRARAESMLREARLPIAEISYLLGYADASTFHRAFRRWTGSTPGDWRERHCGAPDHGGERDSGPESGGQTRHR